ncbi:Spt4/RpoE2 zinc finger protein (macronuclear) [Tetrahymena thermophila SB210]|uniref:Spt4/RpoE2 zinc finger protein n=1 Tax=Tetrahymena thermophila (strain SB210) TaxID=312017 RepID=A4VDJ6_TETTS|nr:Spt4/RpoE2 zinc finger protein [Tetrahymena thermophila SB210]EDK31595.1 Spt4/RpoE2 zinc finger protein [Tetrahymena thermophila SB210]|eukprot:XP_001471396.1 Spt4/RpoE2 zinc finger protein [Tetrahymena thermophila SB210]
MADFDYDEEEQDFENYDEDVYNENIEVKKIIPPNDFKRKLLACTNCYFILTQEQWRDYQNCPNCDVSSNNPKPTAKFTGITCITDPAKSWQTNRMRIVKRKDVKVPGAYAVNINEDYDYQQDTFE